MSLATRQTLSLLSLVSGALIMMEEEDMLCESTIATHAWANDQATTLISRYPATGNERRNLIWIVAHRKMWSRMINESEKMWSPCVLVSLSLHIMSDLADKIKNIDVLYDLRDLRESIEALSAEIGKEVWSKEEFVSLSEADAMLGQLYTLIGFER